MQRRTIRRLGKLLLVLVVTITAFGVIAAQAGKLRAERAADRRAEALLAAGQQLTLPPITEADIAHLPGPVQRWLRWAQVIGKPHASTVRLEQEGRFRLQEGQRWMPFTATQVYTVDPPGFVWTVEMQMVPLITIRGYDQYEQGTGRIEMSIHGLIPVASGAGGDLNQGAALRYLNEIMWFPTAALSQHIRWEPIDDTSALAVLTYGGESVNATFFFDAEGRITNMTANRFNDDRNAMYPWWTPISGYGSFAGVQIPVHGRGVWEYESGDFEYIDLTITSVEYDP
jgi:hypothetical protein